MQTAYAEQAAPEKVTHIEQQVVEETTREILPIFYRKSDNWHKEQTKEIKQLLANLG